ncbi:MAG: ZIP family metal transporter [Bacteroidetes bacterium HGW-Bacteroidetes-2]|jgi:zinc transporter ZupT|nr:MAG: ZIP family metal transporter [Bacteroidetes bacterium HGW-Bacteroidetes-2]
MNYLLPILAIAAGYFFVILFKPKKPSSIKLFLAFSGAFLLALTVFEFLPEVYASNNKNVGIFIMGGILLQIFLEFFSKGAEHGHVHLHADDKTFPWMLFISLSIHSFLEGIPIHEHDTLLLGIIIHKMPIAIILTLFFIEAKYSQKNTLLFLFLFSLMTPLGSFTAEKMVFIKEYYIEASAIVIGIFLHVSTTILFESSEGHKFNLAKLIVVIFATFLAYLL